MGSKTGANWRTLRAGRRSAATIISAVDLEAWLASLPENDQEILAMRQAGSTLADIAEHLDVSVSKVFSRLKMLGLQLADRAGLPVAGTTPSAA